MRDDGGDKQVEAVLQHAFENLVRGPRRVAELSARRRVTINEPLDAAVNSIEEHRIGTGPAAPDSTEERTDIKQREREPSDDEEAKPQVLCDECQADEVKASILHIEEHGRKSVY